MKYLVFSVVGFTLAACGGGEEANKEVKNKNEVIIHQLGDPESLNPFTAHTVEASYIHGEIFESLFTVDPKTYEFKPYLADSFPVVKVNDKDSTMEFTFTIRKEATWPDGTPIKAKDALFSLKQLKNPHLNCPSRSAYENFVDIKIDPKNDRRFTMYCNILYSLAEIAAEGLTFYNSKVLDPTNVLASYDIRDLAEHPDKFENDAKLKAQAEPINTSFATTLPAEIGSGAYIFEKYVPTQRVVLKKNANWWGFKVKDLQDVFYANPEKLVYETNTNTNSAVVALKSGEMDAMERILPRTFAEELMKDEALKNKLHLMSPTEYGYEYIAINTKHDKLQDVRVRQAISHLVNIDKIIETMSYGLAEKATTFIPSDLKQFYNSDLKYPEFSIAKAKSLLAEAGWKDSNGDGVVDKMIKGKKVELVLSIASREGRDWRINVCKYLLESFRLAGIGLNIQIKEWGKVMEQMDSRNFELLIIGVSGAPFEGDYKDSWHTSAIPAKMGRNYTGFGNAKSDKLLDEIRVTLDKAKRGELYKQLQQIVADEVPIVYLVNQKATLGVNKRFTNVYPTGLRPGFIARGFKLN